MRVTVCELRNTSAEMEKEWQKLVDHVQVENSDLLLLPEMPFYPWVAGSRKVHPQQWHQAVAAHENWISRLAALGASVVIGSRPIIQNAKRLNEGFVWEPAVGYRPVHTKYYLPDEEGFWEASWYQRGEKMFESVPAGGVRIGFLICTELWFSEHARHYARQGVHILACPRATPLGSTDKWVAGGRTAAVVSGAYCLSSNFSGQADEGPAFGGTGWVIDPEEGDVIGRTSADHPFLTVEIDPGRAVKAKKSYPRYVLE